MKTNYTTSLTFKLSETEEIVGILPLYIPSPQISPLFHYYAKNCLHIGLTFATLKVQARSIRLLYDFYYQQDRLTEPSRKTFLEAFATYLNKRESPLIKDLSDQSLKRIYPHIKYFCKWVSVHSHLVKNTQDEDLANLIKESYEFLHRLGKSQLFHNPKSSGFRDSSKAEKIVKAFPVDKIMALIKTAKNPRDKLLYCLLAFGGRRTSELLNLWVEDFKIDQGFKVILSHPEIGLIRGVKREDVLQRDYNLKPRTQMSGTYRVGFRSIRFEDNINLCSKVIFIGAVEKVVYELHLQYMEWRKQFTHHPFYFCGQNGDPLKEHRFHERFLKDCKKVGLKIEKTGIKDGSTPFGLRMFYGYYLSKALELDKVIVQRLVGLTHLEHTNKYYTDRENIFKDISKLQEKFLLEESYAQIR